VHNIQHLLIGQPVLKGKKMGTIGLSINLGQLPKKNNDNEKILHSSSTTNKLTHQPIFRKALFADYQTTQCIHNFLQTYLGQQ
jgi:hypothetical protein